VDHASLTDWIARYEALWRTAGTDRVGELFTAGATYSPGPFEPTRCGLAEIAELWDGERDSPDETFRMTSEVVAVERDTGVARIEVWYDDPPPRHYRDLWIVRLDPSGRCTHFEEWPTWPGMGTHPTNV
jgi:hypothetical protein